jgi:hypothetical protein
MKHISRILAEKKFTAASAAIRCFRGDDVRAYELLDEAFKAACAELVAAEMAHPTPRELARRANRLRLENMGLVG